MDTGTMPSPARTVTGHGPARPRAKWPLWGAATGILGLIADLIANPQAHLTEAQSKTGAQVLGAVDRAGYHVAVVAGFLAVACLLVTATAWRRWTERDATGSLAARVVPNAMVASAGAMIAGYGLMGSLAVYLPGGINDGMFPREGLYSVFMIVDFLPFVAWLGVTVAVAAIAWMAFGDHLVARWIGVVCILATAAPAVLVAVTGLPGIAGITGPIAMAVVFMGLAFSRNGRIGVV